MCILEAIILFSRLTGLLIDEDISIDALLGIVHTRKVKVIAMGMA
jgi:hypothetical protein